MDFLLKLKRPFIYIKRFRKRCGYGVHSPFAFNFITNVIYEKTPYYAYDEIKQTREYTDTCHDNSEKMNRLLFRLVNKVQPDTIVTTSNCSSSLYLKYAKKNACFIILNNASYSLPQGIDAIDFLYLSNYREPVVMEKLFENCLPHIHHKSLCVVKGIRYSKAMKSLWQHIIVHECVGITFDLYDFGILFFDKTKLKQHYIVNF